ncbi:MAG: MBL fold metallo-hydrolase [bacterium]|nr:MBL fold metallo-hydrolase [bacterium]
MRLTVLLDNNTFIDRYFLGEPGVSYLIEDNGLKVLFDVGYSDVFMRNAQKMNIPLWDVDNIVISHGHTDHTGGFESLIKCYSEWYREKLPHKKPGLIAHPLAFCTKKSEDFEDNGSLVHGEKLANHFKMELSKEPRWLNDCLVFLGEIPRCNDFELPPKDKGSIVIPSHHDFVEVPELLKDDSALVYKSPDGLVIITGCSHAGICNIVHHAQHVCNEKRILDIIGGLHLLDPPNSLLQNTCAFLKDVNPTAVHACHCTGLDAKIALAASVNLKEVGVGLKLEWPAK